MQNNNQFQQLALIAGGVALAALALHFYYFCYGAFAEWHLTATIVDRFAIHLAGPLHHKAAAKSIILVLGALALLGIDTNARPLTKRMLIKRAVAGSALYFGSDVLLLMTARPTTLGIIYMLTTIAGLISLLTVLQPLIAQFISGLTTSVFNDANETFPQQERLLPSPQSIHLKATYKFRNQVRHSMINLDPYPGTLVMGKPGSGKTRYIFRQLIRQSLAHKMALFVYDLKYPGLTRLTYNTLKTVYADDPHPPTFYSLNFDDLTRSHRCNPLDPATLTDISDAAEAARTMLLALNRKWIDMQGDFFCESAISFFTANIWFLREYENGRYCTLPHLIELIQTPYHNLFSILRSYPQIETLINSFVVAYEANTMEQLQGQVDSARVPLASLASPQLYYLLSANEFTLDINNPQHPKVICLGSNPQKQHIYGAIVSLYVSRLLKLINHSGGHPCHILADEFSSFYCPNMAQTIAVGREHRVAITLGIQDLSQLRAEYGRTQADALFNLPGNILSGRVTGDSARLMAENFPKIHQDRRSVSKNSRDTSTSQSTHLDPAVPASKIAQLSVGEFVGVTADTPLHPNKLKGFHCKLDIDHKAIEREELTWSSLPVIRSVDAKDIEANFEQIKNETKALVSQRLAEMLREQHLAKLILVQNRPSQGQKRPHK
jgi:hypothetical protein